MMVQSFLEPSKPYATNEEFIYTALLVKKVCIRRAEHSVTKKRYLQVP